MNKQGYVYMMMNPGNTVVYTGVTSGLAQRAFQHRESQADGFTKKYRCTKLVFYEIFSDIHDAIQREKQIKGGSRAKKLALISERNPEFKDLYEML